jgi:hypothetical protein
MPQDPPLNFFIIGAAKGGTTAVYSKLSAHPAVFLSPLKEPNFYAAAEIDPASFSPAFRANTPDDLDAYFSHRPLASRQIGFVRNPQHYAALFKGVTPKHQVVGEASTTYLWSQTAPAAVASAHPTAKIVICLRDPVERLFSHYLMARKYGFTTETLLDAVATDRAHPSPGWGRSELFVELGLYADQVARWLEAFPASQVHIVQTTDLSKSSTWVDLQNWLGIEPIDLSAAGEQLASSANPAGLARFERLNTWLTRLGAKRTLAALIPRGLKAVVLRLYYTSEGLPTLTDADRAALAPLFTADQARLTELLKAHAYAASSARSAPRVS